MMEYLEMIKIAAPLLAIGGAWGGAKVALNGTRERVKDVAQKLEDHIDDEHRNDIALHERMTGVETKIDILIDRSTR
jgi:hypothetical protein